MKPATEASPKVKVRPAAIEDAPALARLSDQLGYPSSEGQIVPRLAQILKEADHALFVAELKQASGGSCVVGWVHGSVRRILESNPFVEIGGLVVDEEQRGGGIGRMLMDQIEAWAREAGCESITVRSNVIRERAHAFYVRCGYAVVKSQRVFRKAIAR